MQKEGSGVDLQMVPAETGLEELSAAKDREENKGKRMKNEAMMSLE